MDNHIKEFLEKNNIDYILHTHKAVFTCEEASIHCQHVGGTPCKNLFLKDENSNYFLIILPAEKRLDLKKLKSILEVKKLSFTTAEQLKDILNLTPGSVSIMGLLNDKEKKTFLVIDEQIWTSEKVNAHPNINTESLELDKDNFHKLIETFRKEYTIIRM